VYFVISSGSTFDTNDKAFSRNVGAADCAADIVPSKPMRATKRTVAESFLIDFFICFALLFSQVFEVLVFFFLINNVVTATATIAAAATPATVLMSIDAPPLSVEDDGDVVGGSEPEVLSGRKSPPPYAW
jgi:hypothetical protein